MKTRRGATIGKVVRILIISAVIVLGITVIPGSGFADKFMFDGTSFAFASAEDKVLESLEKDDYKTVVKIYNKSVAGNRKKEKSCNEEILSEIDDITLDWTSGKAKFDTAESSLKTLKKINNADISAKAKEQLHFIRIEKKGNGLYGKAEKSFADCEYYKSLKYLSEIDSSYSQYDSVIEFKGQCEEILLALISSPTTKEEYKECQHKIDKYIAIDPAECFVVRKQQLADEKDDFNYAAPILKKAKKNFNNSKYRKSFTCLEKGLEKYPENRFLKDALDEYHNIYLVSVIQRVKVKIAAEKYDDALKIIDSALKCYDCDELRAIREYVKESKSPIYKAKNNIVAKFRSIIAKYTSDDFDVEEAKRSAGEYVTRSGKRFVLGDYSEEEVTLLSASGDIMTSVLGVDAATDVRDLSYDMTHWGEEEYFAVRLATDVVALVPVVGAVKYLKYSKDAAKGVKRGAKTAKAVIGGTTVAAKQTNKIINQAVALSSNAKQSAAIASGVLKHYKKIETVNESLCNKTHPISGVVFKSKKIVTPDGRKIKGVFAVFDSKADVILPPGHYRSTSYMQKKYLISDLQKQLDSGKLTGIFSEQEVNAIKNGQIPEKYAWHKSEETGRMKLVDKEKLKETDCTNGETLWGKKSKFNTITKGNQYFSKDDVAKYIHKYGELPPNYVTKQKAHENGWNTKLNPTESSPGYCIGGNTFWNGKGLLPKLGKGEHYIECDVDYENVLRGTKRLVYSPGGEKVYYTDDHYETFVELY